MTARGSWLEPAIRPDRAGRLASVVMAPGQDDQAAPSASIELRRTLGCFATGVAIVTTLAPAGRRVGLTVNSFSSLSLEPPLVLWSLQSSSPNRGNFLDVPHFAINVLAEDQEDLSRRFANPTVPDKFAGLATEVGLRGIPLIRDCLARLECVVEAVHSAGDHDLFIGRVECFDRPARDRGPLIFCRGTYIRSLGAGP